MEGYKIDREGHNGLVSIVIPTHNRSDLIVETINSLLEQTYKNIELIIVDDHSTDGTKERISKYVEGYDFIHYYNNLKKGACAARNIGISKSKGEYIQFLDDDDLVHKEFIEKRVEVLNKNPQAGFATCNMLYFQDDITNVVKYFKMDDIQHDIYNHLLRSALPAPLFLFRRSTILSIGFWDEKCLRYQDIRYYHRLFLKNIVGVWLPDYLYFVRVHQHSISKKNDIETMNSILDVYCAIKREWSTITSCQIRRLSRILFLLSILTVMKSRNKMWALRKIVVMSVYHLNDFLFLVKFIFNKVIFGKKAIDFY